jgi:hypothetical protein
MNCITPVSGHEQSQGAAAGSQVLNVKRHDWDDHAKAHHNDDQGEKEDKNFGVFNFHPSIHSEPNYVS